MEAWAGMSFAAADVQPPATLRAHLRGYQLKVHASSCAALVPKRADAAGLARLDDIISPSGDRAAVPTG